MQTVAIVNTRPTLLHLPPAQTSIKDAKDQERIDTGDPFTLAAGDKGKAKTTEVPEGVWERASKHRVIKDWLRIGWIRVATQEDTAPENRPVDLATLAPVAAVAVVEVEDSRATLDGWLKAEERQVVRSAITARISRVSVQKK